MDIQKVLLDFDATIQAKPELTDDELLQKFPEFENDTAKLVAARDYSATLNSDKYKGPEEFNDKFPEFFEVKKKDGTPTGGTPSEVTSQSPSQLSSGVTDPTEESIQQLLIKRKAASDKKAAKAAANMPVGPGAVPLMQIDTTDLDGEISTTETKIKEKAGKLGFKVDKVDDFFKDINGLKASSLSDETLQQLFSTKDSKPKTYSRQIANLKWTDAVRSVIKSEKPEAQEGLMTEFNDMVNYLKSGSYGEGGYNESLIKAEKALGMIMRMTAGDGDARRTAIENFKADFLPSLGRHIISDPAVAKSIATNGGTYETKIAQDFQSIFDKSLAAQNEQLDAATFESGLANQGKQRRQADNENLGLGIIASGLSDYYEGNLEKIKAANNFLDENKDKLKTLSSELSAYKGPSTEAAKSIASLQGLYSRELATFKEMKELVESGKGTRDDKSLLIASMTTLNTTAKRINQLAAESADPAIQSKVEEYNAIAEQVQGFTNQYKGQDILSKWNQYIENRKNTQFQRYPVKAIDQELEDRQNYYGSNTNALEKAIVNVAEFGRSGSDFLSMVYENMFYDADEQLEADFERIGRDDADRFLINYETESQSLRQRPFVTVYSDDIKAKLDAVNNDDTLSKEEKYKRSYKLFTEGRKNGSIYTTTNQNAGDYNITAKSVLNTVATVMPQIATQYAFAAATGGAGSASALRTTAGLVTGTFLQGYSQYHSQAVREGIANPDQYAFGHSIIDALTESFSIKDFEMLKKVGATLKGGAGKFVQDLTETQYKKLMDGSLKTFQGLGTTIKRNIGSNIEEAFVEETSAQLLGNVLDNAAFNKNVEILEGVADAGVTTSIGMLPMTLLGIPIGYKNANIGSKYQFYAAGQNSSESIAAIQEQLQNGDISQAQADQRIEAVNAIAATIKNMPKTYADGKPMRDDHKAEYAFNQFIIDRSKVGLNNLPADQQENVKKTVAEAEAANSKILSTGGFTLPSATVTGQRLSNIERAPAGKRLFNEPNPEAAAIEKAYKESKGITAPDAAPITALDEERSKKIADAYQAMQDSPNDPEVQKAYEALANETMDQFNAISNNGVKVELWNGKGEPYKNSAEMIADVRDNKHMYIFSTEEGFGENPLTDTQREQNALLRDSGAKDVNGKTLLYNDIFRFVHDYFGHTRLGNSFGAVGEENAWNVHARMYSPLARRAMTTETRGQNSWVNFNTSLRNADGSIKKKGDEGYVAPAERPFAEQKMGLLPEEFSNIEDNYSLQDAKESDVEVSNDATGFANQADKAKASQGMNGITMAPYTQEEFDQMAADGAKFFRTKDGMAVGAVKANGEIVSLVKNYASKLKGAGQAIINKMKTSGGLFMENYDGYLTKQYEKAGFKVVARVPFDETQAQAGWDAPGSPIKNKPDVVFMAREDFAAEEKTFATYDEAKAYTESIIKQGNTKFADNVIDKANKNAPVIENVEKALKATGVKVEVIEDEAEFNNKVGQQGLGGVFIAEDGSILLNKASLDKSVNAGRIIFHEGAHPIMNIIRNTNKPLYDKVVAGMKAAAKGNQAVNSSVKWAEKNYEGQEIMDDEALIETIAKIADGTLKLGSIDAGFKQAIVEFVNKIAKSLGLPTISDTNIAEFKKLAGEVANALKEGRDVSEIVGAENVTRTENNLESPEVFIAGEMAKGGQAFKMTSEPAVDIYESKEVSKLPVKSIEDVHNEYGGKATVINSDPTRVGELTLPSGKKIFMYGGPGYLSIKQNVDGAIGFATTQMSKVKSWSKYVSDLFGTAKGVTLIGTQAPTSMMANSYALRYVLDAISTLPKSVLKSKEFKDEFFGKDLVLLKDAFGEKGYNEFVTKYKKADLSDAAVIDGMISEMAYKVGDDNKPASFKARGAFVSNLLGGIALKSEIKSVEGDKGYVSKKPTKFIAKQLFDRLGLNQEKLFYELGEKSLVDLYMNEGKWGMAVAGFETNADSDIATTQDGGVKHPLFNAKFPGSNAFLLDGAYELDQLFTPQQITANSGNPYTKRASLMLAGSMYVKGGTEAEGQTFEYKTAKPAGPRIQARRMAPNGKPSNLNEKQYEQVRTPEFKAWFGDWENDPENASKVVDKNGEPLVVYHGSTKSGIEVFDPEGRENAWDAEYPEGTSFFTDSESRAKLYGGVVYPVFLDLKYPLKKKVRTSPENYIDNNYEVFEDGDGIVEGFIPNTGKKVSVYFTGNPNSIKSATSNSGAFSKTDNRIQARVDQDNSLESIPDYIASAQSVLGALYPNATLEVYDTQAEFVAAAGQASRGYALMNKDGKHRIMLNLEAIKKDGSGKTAFHEVIHPIVYDFFGVKQTEIVPVWNQLYEKLKDVKGFEAVLAHISRYDADQVAAEGITETLAQIANGTIDINDVPKSSQSKVIELVNKLFEKLGINFKINTPSDFKKLAESIKDSFENRSADKLKEFVKAKNIDKYIAEEEARTGKPFGAADAEQKDRGFAKTFPVRGTETVNKISADAKTYFVKSNKQTTEEVNAFMEGRNPEDVLDYLLAEPTDIPGRVRIWMSGVVMDKIDEAIVAAKEAGDTKEVDRLSTKQAQLINQISPLGTELGQAIQAFRRFYQNASGSAAMLNYFTNNILSKIEKEAGRKLTEEEIATVTEMAKKIQEAPEGLPKDEATFELGNYAGKITPINAMDIAEAIWYAHILSGITTQSTNFFANFWNTFAEGTVTGIREAIKTRSLMPMIYGARGFFGGLAIGARDGADVFMTGLTPQDADKYNNKNILEYFSWKQTKAGKLMGGKVGGVLDYAGGLSPKVLKYVGRALAATDAAFSRANSEAISNMMAYTQALEEGKTNPTVEIKQRVDEILNKTSEKVADAQEQAVNEGYEKGTRRYKRRVYQILEQGRDKEMLKEAEIYGKKVTLNYEPEGFMRPVYQLALGLQKSTKLTKMFLPFTRIVVNLTENSLNYTPLGFWKAAVGTTSTDGGRRKLSKDERADFAIKATLGLATFVGLAALTGDDEDDLFDITANGSGDVIKNYELRKAGWRPYSIKLKDGRYISYKDWPIMPVLAALGAMHDHEKYSREKQPASDAVIALQGMVNSLYEKSVMKGLQDFVEIFSPKQEYNQASKFGDRIINWGSDQAKSLAISNFTQQSIKFTSEYMDNPIKAAKGAERIYRDIPYLNDGLNPIIDVFGEPVKPSTSEKLLPITVGKVSKDAILSALNENGVFIGKPQTREVFVNDTDDTTRPMTDQEYYNFTKKSGQLTKQYIMEDWKEIQEILAIKDKKERQQELQAFISQLTAEARADAMEMFE